MEALQRKPERIANALAVSRNDDALVGVVGKNGTTYVVTIGDLRNADILRLPTGSMINLQESAIQCDDEGGTVPTRHLVTYPWSYVREIPSGARVVNVHTALK